MSNLEENENFFKKHLWAMLIAAFFGGVTTYTISDQIRVQPKDEHIKRLDKEITSLKDEIKTLNQNLTDSNKEKNKIEEILNSYKQDLRKIRYQDLHKNLEESKKTKKTLEKISSKECDHWGSEDKNGKIQLEYDQKCLKEKENAKNELTTINEEIKRLEKDIKNLTEN